VSAWTLLEIDESANAARAVLRLVDSDATRALWPHAFSAELTVVIGGASLEISLAVTNTADAKDGAFSFTAALHPYFRTADAYRCEVEGLGGLAYRDSLRARAMFTEGSGSLAIREAVDRVYFDVPGPLLLREPSRGLRIERSGFPDVVVWNPGAAAVQQRADFHEGDETRFVCVEAAAIGHPVVLQPGDMWTGVQRITAV